MLFLFNILFAALFSSTAWGKNILFLECSKNPCRVAQEFPGMIPKRLKFVSVDRYDVTIDLNGIKVPYPPLGKALFAELNDLLDISALVVQKKNAFSYYSRKARLRQLSLLEVTHRLAELVIGFDFYYSYKDKHYYFSRKKASFSPKSQVALFHSAKRKTIVGLFQVSSAQGQIVLLKPILLDKKIPPKNFSPVKVFQ